MADRWKVTVMFDRDGTNTAVFTGWRISSQIWPPAPGSRTSRCLVRVHDEDNEVTAVFQSSATWTVERERING